MHTHKSKRRALLVVLAMLVLGVASTACNQSDIAAYQAALSARGHGDYVHFSDCRQAVDYLFAGRWDHDRAIMVIRRESRFNPNVSDYLSGTHKGCAQLSSGLRAKWLKGPWNDPYYNILAFRDIVSSGGWCHWDIVNYCAPGGAW